MNRNEARNAPSRTNRLAGPVRQGSAERFQSAVPLRTCFKIGGATGTCMDQAGRCGTAQRMLVARASRHVPIQRSVPGAHPGVPIF